MSNCSKFISLCLPCSTKHHAWLDFFPLKGKEKALIGVVTGLVALLSLPIFGLLGVLAFRCLVKRFSAKKIINPSALDKKIEAQKTVHLSNETVSKQNPLPLHTPINSTIKLKRSSPDLPKKSITEIMPNESSILKDLENTTHTPIKTEQDEENSSKDAHSEAFSEQDFSMQNSTLNIPNESSALLQTNY